MRGSDSKNQNWFKTHAKAGLNRSEFLIVRDKKKKLFVAFPGNVFYNQKRNHRPQRYRRGNQRRLNVCWSNIEVL